MILRELSPSDVSIFQFMGNDRVPYKMARLSYGGDDNPDENRLFEFLNKLYKNGHFVPFEHCVITYHLTAPIYVFRQIFRYRTSAISERSLRYCEASPEFYCPNNASIDYKNGIEASYQQYLKALDNGLPKEQARGLLPLSIFSSAYFTMNLRNLFHFWDQRIDSHAQSETRYIATQMLKQAQSVFPIISRVYCLNHNIEL